jgi:hypothetical protein
MPSRRDWKRGAKRRQRVKAVASLRDAEALFLDSG